MGIKKNNHMRILFRTSGGRAKNKELGMGHIYRCLNLADNLKNQKKYFLVENYGGINNIFQKYTYEKLEPSIKLEMDIKKTINFINKNKIDLIVIDKYKVNKKYVKKIKQSIKTVVITDLKNIDYDADLLINGFIGYKNSIKKNRYGTRCLLGTNFQILNKKFEQIKKTNKENKILITFGGYDEKNISKLILKELEYNLQIKIKLVLGLATKNSNILKQYKKNEKIDVIQSTSNMYKEMSKVKFGLCSGGLTTYEFSAMNVPFGIICQNKHQLETANQWEKKKNAINLGIIDKKKIKPRMKKFLKWIKTQKYVKTEFVDGKGGKRAAAEILKILQSTRLGIK